MSDRVEALLSGLTLEEKTSLTAGADLWHTPAVERVGLPALKVSDGPNGVRGRAMGGGPSSACFPCGSALASTWNPELVGRVGRAVGEEARSKQVHVVLAPTVNIHRSPLGGRNFECHSEDPHLSARTAVAFIDGVQSQGVGCCVKHFACNDSEFERNTISSRVGERALREIYLPPFEAAICEAGVWSIMTAYNKVNGTYSAEHARLLREILKGEWGFDGFVVSDWFGTRSTIDSANHGLDLEMPGPGQFLGPKLLDAVKDGLVDEGVVDDMVRRLLRIAERTGALDAEPASERAEDLPEHRDVARQAAGEAIVLLKNERSVLPLDPAGLHSLAVIGPNAEVASIQGGGSARVSPHYQINPLEALRKRVGDAVDLRVELGCTNHRVLPPLGPLGLTPPSKDGVGLLGEYFSNLELEGEPVIVKPERHLQFHWFGRFSDDLDPGQFSARFSGTFTPDTSGDYTFGLTSAGKSRLFVDGVPEVDNWTRQERGDSYFGLGSTEVTAQVRLEAGRPCKLRIEYTFEGSVLMGGLNVGCLRPIPDDLLERAVATAAGADAAVIFAGSNADWETEGRDRTSMALPGRQAELIERVAAANPRTVVVLNAGAPVEADWIDAVPSALAVWYPGQEAGNAISDVLFGDRNPAGRLPTTWPRRLQDNPAFVNYPGENGEVIYGEGIFVGYRYYEAKQIEPRFAFGHGQSYTTFGYGELRTERERVGPDDPIRVWIDVTNTGERRGQEVVQLYVEDPESRLARPPKELRSFRKIELDPGETRTVAFELDRRALSYYDPARSDWVAEPGVFELLVGASSRDIRSRAQVVLED